MISPGKHPVLEARDISFSVRDSTLVRQASLALHRGRMTILIGPNGAGKSTLLKLLSGEITPQSGEILSLGAPLRIIPAWRLACRRAVMAQANRMTFPFAVHEVVRLGLEGIGRAKSRDEIEAILGEALVTADISPLAGRNYQNLSGGEQQRVQFARVLCQLSAGMKTEPVQALLLDEPTASLDLCHQLALLDAATALVRERNVAGLAVLHDLNLAAAYADHLVVLNRSEIVAAGTPEQVLTRELIREVFRVEIGSRDRLSSGVPVILPQFRLRGAGT